jgi:hypothetical protein
MSTQRREDGCTPATRTYRRGPRNRWQRMSCTDGASELSLLWLALVAWFARVTAKVGMAPPKETVCFPTAWLATNSLHSDHHATQLVRQDFRRTSCSSPPLRAARSATVGKPATRRSSLPLILFPSALVSLHPSLPNYPAGQCRWTERYDGKRDLHFLNAA